MKKHLNISPLKQIDDHDCSIACAEIILKHYGMYASRKEIEFFLKREKFSTPDAMQIAEYLRFKGFDVNVYSFNLYFFSPKDYKLSQKQLLSKLKKQKKHPWLKADYKIDIEYLIKAIEAGVFLNIEPPNSERILDSIQKDIPAIVAVNSLVFYETQGDPFSGHDIVVSGFEKDKVFFADPGTGKIESRTLKHFMLGVHARKFINTTAWMITATPRKDRLGR